MSILSGIKKVIPYFKNADGNYEQLSYKTSSQTVDFDDGKTAETKLGAIKGITTSTSVTETGYAADAKTVSKINQSLDGVKIYAIDNIDEFYYNPNKLGIGYLIQDNNAYLEFDISWIHLQFRIFNNGYGFTWRAKHGNNDWNDWSTM